MVEMKILKDRDEWLDHRKKYIGGSDASSIIGMNPYCSNVELWRRKTGRTEAEDISEKSYVKYGNDVEPIMRALFTKDYPDMTMFYEENNSFSNTKYPFAKASLDGWLEDSNGVHGIWECKTSEIVSSMHKEKWKDQIPDNYYCQLLHYFAIREDCQFAILTACLTYKREDAEVYHQIKNYRIERSDVQDDIDYLINAEKEFYTKYIMTDTEPSLILPGI